MLNKFHITTTMLAQAVWFLDRLASVFWGIGGDI